MAVTIDVVIMTRNEARNITDCLRSIQGLGRALVIDDHSCDDTVALAEAGGATVYLAAPGSISDQKNFALTKVTADWVFFLDADERPTPKLVERIKAFVELGPAVGEVGRHNYAFGRKQRFGPLAPERLNRLFPKDSVSWIGLVHEYPVSDLPVRPVGGILQHFTYYDWSQYLDKVIRYTRLHADNEYEQGCKVPKFLGVGQAAASFLKAFFLKLGIFGGPVSWVLCCYSGFYFLTKNVLLHQKYENAKKGGD